MGIEWVAKEAAREYETLRLSCGLDSQDGEF